MGRKLLELAGSFLGFSVATVLACLHYFDNLLIHKQLFNMSSDKYCCRLYIFFRLYLCGNQ